MCAGNRASGQYRGVKVVGIGMIGAGFIAETRARAYAGVAGYDARIVAIASRTRERATDYARRHGVANVDHDYRALLARSDVDVVDLCVPNAVHREIAVAAA